MESSAVIYCNSVLGARTNTEGRESTSAAMLTGRIPDWGLHRVENRFGTHRVIVEVPIESVMDWGMLGYFVGDAVQEHIPVVVGPFSEPEIVRLKHFGAAASSSGGVEMYHIVGFTPEAASEKVAFGPRKAVETFTYGKAEQRRVYDQLNANATDPAVDYVMLGCPHAALEQLEEAARLLAGRKVHCELELMDLHVTRRQGRCRPSRLYEDHYRRRRRGHDGHVLRLCPGHSSRDEGCRARLGQTGALSAGDSRHPGMVRFHPRLHRGGD